MANRYSKALKHLKNKNIDEKLKLLEQIPTNNTAGLYVDTPGTFEPEKIEPGDLPFNDGLNLVEDGQGQESYTGNDTTGLFLTDGTIKSIEPPGDTSYILGPMISMWYAWADYTQIGYVRQSDRKMVNLGRITGEMSDWDGETGFTGYGQMSLEQAVWFKGQTRADYRAFYPGPPSNPADEYGRYIGSMISSSKSTQTVIPQVSIPGINRSSNPTDDLALAMDRGGAALGIGLAIWMSIEGGKIIKNIIDNLTPEQQDRLFDRSISMFGDTDAAGMAAEANIGSEMAMIRDRPGESPYNIQWPRKPGQKTKPGPGARPSNQPMGPKLPLATNQQDTIIAHHILSGRFIREEASGGGTITAHTDAGDVTINIPSTPPMPPNRGIQTTPQEGLPTDYSKSTLNWLKSQSSDGFITGYIKVTEQAELEKMFTGTTVSWYKLTGMVSTMNEYSEAAGKYTNMWIEKWEENSPKIAALRSTILAGRGLNYTMAMAYRDQDTLAQINRLFAENDRIMATSQRYAEMSFGYYKTIGNYVRSGKLVDTDPFKLNDPTIKKEKEFDEKQISEIINKLKQENSELSKAILLRKLKMFGMGALVAAAAVIGFKIVGGVAGIKALGAPAVNMIKSVLPKVKVAGTKVKYPTTPKTSGTGPWTSSSYNPNKPGGGPARKRFPVGDSYQPSGKLLTESQKKVLRDIKKPVQVKEIPTKFKVKPTGRKNKSVGVDMMKIPDVPKQYKPQMNIWGKADYAANVRASQEKKNEVLELVGAAEHHWTYLTEDRRKKQQEKVNEMMSVEYDKQMELLYEKHRIKESKITKAISAFRKSTDIKPEYPENPPPQLDPETGMHPKYGKRYKHDKLDPHSAEFMPPTGDPVIDANIKKATNDKEKSRKLKILLGNRKKISESMTTSDLFSTTLPATGDAINFTINSAESDAYNLTTGNIEGSWVNLTASTGATRQSFDYGTGNGAFSGTIDSALYFAVPFNGDHSGTVDYFYATTRSFEVKNNSLTFSAIAGNSSSNAGGVGSNGGTLPFKDLSVYWVCL